jgi:hypothetical protein
MRGRFGIEGRGLHRCVFSISVSPGFLLQGGFAPLIRPCGPPSPRWGEEGVCGSLNTSSHARKNPPWVCFMLTWPGRWKVPRKVVVVVGDTSQRPVRCLLPRFSGSSALSRVRRKPPMPRPGRLSARPFNAAGFSPGPLDGKTVRRGEPPLVWLPGTPGSFANRRRTAFHAAPGILRAFRQTIRAPAPSRRQRFPVYP